MNEVLKRFWWILAILAVVLIWKSSCKEEAGERFGGLWHSIFHISHFVPEPGDPSKPDSGVVHTDKPLVPFEVGEIEVGHGEAVVFIPVAGDSLAFQPIKIPTHGSGQIRLFIDPITGRLVIDRQRFGFDLALTAGPSIHGLAGGVETLFWNDCLGIADVHLVTPSAEVSIWNEDRGDVYVGLGADAEIYPEHTPIRLQGSYEWYIEDLRVSRLSIGITIPLVY